MLMTGWRVLPPQSFHLHLCPLSQGVLVSPLCNTRYFPSPNPFSGVGLPVGFVRRVYTGESRELLPSCQQVIFFSSPPWKGEVKTEKLSWLNQTPRNENWETASAGDTLVTRSPVLLIIAWGGIQI